MEDNRTPNIICLICSKPIYRRPGELIKTSGHAFCRKEKPCLICRKPIMARFKKKTCSRACANKHRASMKYKLHLPRKDKVVHLRILKLRLLKIRGNNCERCGYNKREILQIHHKDENRANNDLRNLELICPNCHYEGHFLEKSWLKRYN